MPRRLYSASLSNKTFFSFFLILMGLSMAMAFWNFYERTGFNPSGVTKYYLGNVRGDEPEESPLPQEGLMFPKTRREMMEVTHVHIFTIPLIFFVMSRILSMTGMREGYKLATFVASFAGIILNLSGPWLVRYLTSGFSVWLILSYVVLGSVTIVYITYPMYEMWGLALVEGREQGEEE